MCPRPYLWFFAFTTPTLWPELIVSMGPRPHLSFCNQNSDFWIRIASLYGSQPSSVVLFQSKQRLLDQNYKSLWVPDHICYFCMKAETLGPELQVSIGPRPHLWFFWIQNSDFSTRFASLYGSQPSNVSLCFHNSDIMNRINSLYGSQTSPVVLCMQNCVISTRNTSLHGSQTSPVALCMQNNVISIRITSLNGSQPSPGVFVRSQHRHYDQN